MSYATFGRWLDECAEFDALFVQVAPPDAQGNYSLGPAVEFTMRAIAKSRKVIAVVNHNTPAPLHTATIGENQLSYVCEVEAPLKTYSVARDEVSNAVAARIAPLVEDGAVLQIGVGKIPGALLAQLKDRRGLRFWSGLISDGVMDLVEAGATLSGAIGHACMGLGSAKFYDWLHGRDDIVLHGCDRSHGAHELASLKGFVAINSALEVDLFGQCNLERVDGRSLSGAGGAPDFAYAARRTPGGKSIVALPSEANGRSRIVAALGRASMTTLSRTEVDYVVTEHGVADLRYASVAERAEQLIEVASSTYRGELRDAWREIAKKL
jgi:4-hydroxybutyrate CoA-transferase